MNDNIYLKRIEKIKDEAACLCVDAVLITKPENKYYLSGFKSTNYYIVLTQKRNYLLTDFRYIESAGKKSNIFDIVPISNQYTIFDFLGEIKADSLGIEENNITYSFYKELKKMISAKIVCLEGCIEKLRKIKDIYEIRNIRTAAEIADSAFNYIIEKIRPEMTEKEIATELEFHMKKNGADGLSFDMIVASGERSSLPHGVASDRIVRPGDFITLDYGCIINGYCSDMTRTVAVSYVSREQHEIYDLVRKAQEKALESIKPGKKCSEIDKTARDIISDSGYGKQFGHGLGHGVGLEIHEAPVMNALSEDVLLENMVVTVEPGIYLSDCFGVRIEDLIVVSDYGIINLTSSSKELLIL